MGFESDNAFEADKPSEQVAKGSEAEQPSGRNGAASASGDTASRVPAALKESVSMGVDIVEVERIRAILKRSPAFAKRAFSQAEQDYCDKHTTPEFHYATRFAAKEAVLKALGTGFSEGIGLRDVEVVLNAKGKPRVRLSGNAARIAREKGIVELPLSLSYTHVEAVACALALTGDARVEEHEKVDPTKELTRRFKEARAWLDDAPGSVDDGFGEER